ncbi:hypothetical protein [Caulobacter sp. CCG-8]|uniref:hypothetical protein n=1 Tax=Caulobacter sp. CCG-8 TaxID=3127958 RepID=UPI00307DB463
MKPKSEKWLLGLGLAYVLVMPVMISAVVGWKDLPSLMHALGSQTAAAWTQAIGSVLAIAGAIYIGREQARHAATIAEKQAKHATDQRNEALAIPVYAASWAVGTARQFVLSLTEAGPKVSVEEVKGVAAYVDVCAGFLREIRLETMPSRGASHALMQARISVAGTLQILSTDFSLTDEQLSALREVWDTLGDAEVELLDEAMATKYGIPYEI